MAESISRVVTDTKKSFADWSHKYDSGILMPLFFRRIHKKVNNLIGDVNGKSVLDVGCGTGEFIAKISDENPEAKITGIDLSEEMLAIARIKNKGRRNIELLIGDSGKLPFDDERFDYVISTVSLHHWPNQKKSVREIYHVLKPRGKVLIADLMVPGIGGKGTNRILPPKRMRELFSDSGFRNIQQYSASDSGKYGLASAALGIPIAIGGLASANLPACAIAAGMIAGGLTYSCPDWTSRITIGEK